MRSFLQVRRGVLAALVFAAAARWAQAQTAVTDVGDYITDMDGYSLVSLGAVTLDGSSDTEGALAIEGNLTLGGSWDIANNAGNGSNPSLYVSGTSLSLSGTSQLENGYASTPNLSSGSYSWSSSSEDFTGGGGTLHINSSGSHTTTSPISNPGPSGWNWSTLTSNLESISSNLGSQTANGTISVSGGNLVFSAPEGQTTGAVVFDVNASVLENDSYDGNSFDNLSIDVPAGLNYVINVVGLGSDATISGFNFNSGTNSDQVLWNFEGSNTVTIDTGGEFYGSILAPETDLTVENTMDSQIAAASLVDSDCGDGVELDLANEVLAPEPGTYARWALGLCAVGGIFLVRRRRAAGGSGC